MRWIFAYGSLIWRPDFSFTRVVHATLPGWRREFSQASPDHRGTPELPGRVVTLRRNPGAYCEGFAYQVESEDLPEILRYLDFRESGGYTRQVVDVTLRSEAQVAALTYIAMPDNPHACSDTTLDVLVELVNERHGPSGSNRDYVLELAKALAENQILDPVVDDLAKNLLQRPVAMERS